MLALVLDSDGLALRDVPSPVCTPDQVRVRLHAAALNHRDVYITEGKYARIVLPAILGSDGCGEAIQAPEGSHLAGRRVVIDPSLEWGDDPRAQGPGFTVLGMPTQGTLAEEICIDVQYVHEAPSHLTDEQAAALPLAGVTAWRALMVQGALQPHETVLITGIGGGVALMAMQLALAAGARVIVSSTSDEKLERAAALGAHATVNVRSDGWTRAASQHGPVDLIVDSVGGEYINDYTNIVRPGGRISVYGASRGMVPTLNIHRIFWKQITLVGSTMGTGQDFTNMLNFVSVNKIVPVVDSVYSLAEAPLAFERMRSGAQSGKLVIRCK
ncbi:MAG: NAD(P)-dependent alcohol dehydrogenase [Candidatus Kapabacteria bacterium]|nr:NAD(P)-dependent alcohol dehydrogenase [Candidatus Kapabacteria bacterium]